MTGRGIAIAVGAASVASLAAIDVLSKHHARSNVPAVGDIDPAPSAIPRWVHHEHAGPRPLGIAVAAVPAAIGAAGALGVARLGGNVALATAGAVALASGAILNGVELAGRGSNTNPWTVFGKRFNAADVGVVAGVGLLAASALPAVVRAVVR